MPSAPPRLRRAALVTALAVASTGSGLFLPLSLVFFLDLTDIPLALLGVLVGTAGIVTVPIPVIAGWLTDRVPATVVVAAALAVQSAAYLGFTVAREPVAVLGVSVLMSLGSRLYWSSVFTSITDVAESVGSARTEPWFAAANIARTLGIGIGGLVAGAAISLGDVTTYLAIAFAASGCFALAALVVVLFLPLSRVHHERDAAGYRALVRDRPFLALTAVNAVFAVSTMFLGLSLPTVVREHLGAEGWITSALLVGNAVLIALLGAPGSRFTMRYPAPRVLVAGAAFWVAGCAALALGTHLPLGLALAAFALGTVLFSGSEIAHAPTSMAYVTVLAPPALRGRYLSVFQLSFVAAEFVAPILFTSLFVIDAAMPFLAVAALNVLAAATIPAIARRSRVVAR